MFGGLGGPAADRKQSAGSGGARPEPARSFHAGGGPAGKRSEHPHQNSGSLHAKGPQNGGGGVAKRGQRVSAEIGACQPTARSFRTGSRRGHLRVSPIGVEQDL